MRYACSVAATRDAVITVNVDGIFGRVGFVHTVYICDADSDAEAEATAYLFAKDRWSSEDGWKEHSAEVLVVEQV